MKTKNICFTAIAFLALAFFLLVAIHFMTGATIVTMDLTSPLDNIRTSNTTPSFDFIADSDTNDAFSCTLYLNDVPYETDSGVQNDTETTIIPNSTLAEGVYQWYVSCTDDDGTNESSERTITIDNSSATAILNSPASNYNSSSTNVTFNCTSADNTDLANATLYGNWSAWHANETADVSGTSSTAKFSKNISEGRYVWNCLACDAGNDCSFASNNRTFTVDTHYPDISLVSPSDGSNTTSKTKTFKYEVTDNFGVKNCSLYVGDEGDEVLKTTDTSIDNGKENSFSPMDFSEKTYYWYVKCYDYAGNHEDSDEREFTVHASSEIPGSGVSGYENTTKTFEAGNLSMTKSKTLNNLAKGDKIYFRLTNESHTMTMKNISANTAYIEISSKPITAALYVNETKTFDLNGNNMTDFSIKLSSIIGGKANLVIEAIPENISVNASSRNNLTNATANHTYNAMNNTNASANATNSGKSQGINWKAVKDSFQKNKAIILVFGVMIIIAATAIITAKIIYKKHRYWRKTKTSWHRHQRKARASE